MIDPRKLFYKDRRTENRKRQATMWISANNNSKILPVKGWKMVEKGWNYVYFVAKVKHQLLCINVCTIKN